MNRHLLIRGMSYYVHVSGAGPAVLWLHGFTGSHETFLPYIEQLTGFTHVLVDLPGHGKSVDGWTPARMRVQQVASDLIVLMRQLGHERFTAIGYSMGGRLALALAVLAPLQVERLVLESASPGLETWQQRAQRRQVDESRAKQLLHDGLAAFLAEWERLPLFASQADAKPEYVRQQGQIRKSQSATGLCMSLLGHGTGVQPSYWAYLTRLHQPVYLLTGERDAKFTATAKRMLRYLPHGEQWTSRTAGHTVHIEDPETFGAWIRRILNAEVGGKQ